MIASVKGARLFFKASGKGPLCLLPTAIGAGPYELQTPPELKEVLTLAYVELRGSGRSTGEPTELNFEVLSDDLEAVRAELGHDQVAVLGHSIMGMLAIEYARRRPSSVSHVILAGAPPFGDMARLLAEQARFFEEDASQDRKEVLSQNRAALVPGAPFKEAFFAETPMRFFDPRYDPAPLFREADFRPSLVRHVMGTLAPEWSLDEAGSCPVPVLIAHGRYDYTVPYVLWEKAQAKIRSATVRIFERSGHQPFFEEPELFARAVADFMRGAPSKPGRNELPSPGES